MRKKIIAANWKMNKTCAEASSFLETFVLEVAEATQVEIVVVPPFTALGKVSEQVTNSACNVKLGAQNMSQHKEGAYTGEISATMLRELFVRYVVLGHSERRSYYGETDAIVNAKVRAAIDASLKPIVCIGETLEQRDAGKVEEVLETQLRGSLAGLSAKELSELVLAYEPVWAIGTGRTASPEQAQEAHAFIRKTIAAMADAETASKIRIQYGGSVKPDNTETLMGQPDIDGALVGGAALDARSFAQIVHNAAKAAQ